MFLGADRPHAERHAVGRGPAGPPPGAVRLQHHGGGVPQAQPAATARARGDDGLGPRDSPGGGLRGDGGGGGRRRAHYGARPQGGAPGPRGPRQTALQARVPARAQQHAALPVEEPHLHEEELGVSMPG